MKKKMVMMMKKKTRRKEKEKIIYQNICLPIIIAGIGTQPTVKFKQGR